MRGTAYNSQARVAEGGILNPAIYFYTHLPHTTSKPREAYLSATVAHLGIAWVASYLSFSYLAGYYA